VSHWDIVRHVPLDGNISYTDLSEKSGLETAALRRLLRDAMTNGMFYEPTKDCIAHNSMSRILVEDQKTAAWVDLQTEGILLGGAHQCEALDHLPGSESKRETGVSIGFHNPGQTSLYEEIKKKPENIRSLAWRWSFSVLAKATKSVLWWKARTGASWEKVPWST
jgi:hypothetical protein